MDLRSFVSTANSALYTATNYFSIPSGATSKEIRISGVKCIGTGIVCFLVAMVIMFVGGIEHGAGVSLLPNLMGYGFILVGGYRLVFGKGTERAPDDIFSLTRIVFGVSWVVAIFGIPMLLIMYFSHP
jgi:hypothetical protein